jgi:hypothetical protein
MGEKNMSNYFCPECNKIYFYTQLDKIRPEEKVTVELIVNHFLCDCGYEGSLWPDTDQGHKDYHQSILNYIDYCSSVLEVRPTDAYYSNLKKKLTDKYRKLTGIEEIREKKATQLNDAFAQYLRE